MTRAEIKQACEELQNAMLDSLEADNLLTQAQIAKNKSHKRLLLAKEVISSIIIK